MANTVITDYRREQLCKITSGASSTIAPTAEVAVGDGGVDEAGNVLQPVGNQQALTHEIGRYTIDKVEYPVATTARYIVTIPAADLAGEQISEAGLVDRGGNFCAIRNMLAKGKDEGVAFIFTFDDEF